MIEGTRAARAPAASDDIAVLVVHLKRSLVLGVTRIMWIGNQSLELLLSSETAGKKDAILLFTMKRPRKECQISLWRSAEDMVHDQLRWIAGCTRGLR